ncbi:MAG: hypothetical protein U0V70_05860 [Terriglobia bacterium]
MNANYQTTQPHIYAVGDIISFSPPFRWNKVALPPPAFGLSVPINPATYPYGIYTIPEISFIGKTEEQLTDEDVPYEVGIAYYRELPRTNSRDTTGRLKLIFHRETKKGNCWGFILLDYGASEILHIGQAVIILRGN